MIQSMLDLKKHIIALQQQRTISVACADDEDALEAVQTGIDNNIASFIITGCADTIEKIAKKRGFSLQNCHIVHTRDEKEGAEQAVRYVAEGKADIVQKGLVDSAVFMRAALDKNFGLRGNTFLSHVTVLELPFAPKQTQAMQQGALYFLTDAAMNIKPSLDEKHSIIRNAVVVAEAFGYHNPIVGVLCESEKVNPKMAATLDAQELVKANKVGLLSGCRVGGPYALDVAVSRASAEHKGMTDPLAGFASILLAPDLAAGNILYKGVMQFAQAKSAGIIMGATAPIIMTSRSDSPETKLNSMCLGILLTNTVMKAQKEG